MIFQLNHPAMTSVIDNRYKAMSRQIMMNEGLSDKLSYINHDIFTVLKFTKCHIFPLIFF
ncbi:MAG TPA: hypothetical protein DEO71_08580 [Chryseobacterium sp.]|nr:hypothetical protein [Chryseobacterium sp.]